MRGKYYLVILILIFAIFLSGCGVVTPATDEAKVRDVIDEYFLAISEQEWEKARSYCIYESEIYHETCSFEGYIDSLYTSVVDIIFDVDIFDIVINGDLASAYIDGSLTIIIDDDPITSDSSGYFYLQKIGNSWKIYAP